MPRLCRHARTVASATLALLACLLAACDPEAVRDEPLPARLDAGGAPGADQTEGSSAEAGAPLTLTRALSPKGPATPKSPGSTEWTASDFSWTKPPGFDAALKAAIEAQPPYMGGYGGQVSNPFPQLPGSARFSGLQITRVDAITLDLYFGRWAYRFFVDEKSRHSNGLRAEFTGGGDYQLKAGDAYNFRFSVYFDGAYKNSAWTEWNMFAQFHSLGFPAWGLHTAGGYLMMSPPGVPSDSLRVPMPARNKWHEFNWTVRWASDSSGYAKLLVDNVVVFDYHGRTIHSGESTYYPKFGSYLANNPYTQITFSTPWIVTKL